jgi:5-methyltetrahydrofolate--homocysteine methyltransferase
VHRYGLYAGEQWSFTGDEPRAVKVPEKEEAPSEMQHEDFRKAVPQGILQDIFGAIYSGEQDKIEDLMGKALAEGHRPLDIIDHALTPAIREVGEEFSTGELFLPDLLLAATTMQGAMNVITPLMEEDERQMSKARVVIGTIKGDLHDIGKNMVIALLKGNGFDVIDLGASHHHAGWHTRAN